MVAAAAGALALAPAAHATIAGIPSAHDGSGTPIACVAQPAPPENAGERHCSGIFTTFDGAPIDINVAFPPDPGGTDGDFPIVGVFHGWGGSKLSLTSASMQQWLDKGYAVFSMSDRGWGMSCGATDPKRPICDSQGGYNHLMDTRFEVRDAQEVFEALADQTATGATAGEGLIDPQKVASMGSSYGGGISMALGALKNRKMMEDDTLIPWVSDGGKQMQIAAAQPDIPWTDLAYSLQPNGATLDYVEDAPYLGPLEDRPIGVLKHSFVAGLYATGQAMSNYALPGTDPDADLVNWFALVNAGEPYDQPLAADIIDELTTHHSSYYIDDSIPPAPMLISNGWTDDLFPPDEAIRFYNRTRTHHPGTAISIMFGDHGHQRGQGKDIDTEFRNSQLHEWFDYYVKGTGPIPFQGVQTLTQTCPDTAPSGGATGPFDDLATDKPFQAPTWAAIAPGEVRFESATTQTIQPGAADNAGTAFDPIGGPGACATASGDDQPGTASYRLDPAPVGGFTLMGSATIIADISAQSPTSQVAARLLDVDPASGDETLVARGLYRPGDDEQQVFQLHPNGWFFAEDHVAKLELLPADQPYGRHSNAQAQVTVTDLELRLPVVEQPGGIVQAPAPKIVPDGYALAIDFRGGGGAGGGGAGGAGAASGGANDPYATFSCTDLPTRTGSAKDDKLRGTTGDDQLLGRRGADKIKGRAGNDCVFGNQGGDRVSGGRGDDRLRGGGGNDRVKGGPGADSIKCGGGANDLVIADNDDNVKGCERIRVR